MRASKNRLAGRRAWLGVATLGFVACSLALAGAPIGRPTEETVKHSNRPTPSAITAPVPHQSEPNPVAVGGKAVAPKQLQAPTPGEVNSTAAIGSSEVEPVEIPKPRPVTEVTRQRVRAGQMPEGELPFIAKMVVDYRNDEMTKARAEGRLVGPLPQRGRLGGGVATGGCSFAVDCDDANKCTLDGCNIAPGSPADSGKCIHEPVPAGVSLEVNGCDDGEYCNGPETCINLVCHGGSNPGAVCDEEADCLGGGSCYGVCDPNPPAPSCCADRDACMPDFAVCSPESLNAGAICKEDEECRQGECNRCRQECTQDSDCSDERRCTGIETCNLATGQCVKSVNPCGSDAFCNEGRCFGGPLNVQNDPCTTAAACPNSECVFTVCSNIVGGVQKACKQNSDCTAGGFGTCVPSTGVCHDGRCCDFDILSGDHVCGKRTLAECATFQGGGNWYAGDGGREITAPVGTTPIGCGSGPEDRSEPWGCPKYASGITQTTAANPPAHPVTVGPISDSPVCIPAPGGPGGGCADPDGPAGALNQLGDDYAISNNDFIDLDVVRWIGGMVVPNRIIMEFWDNATPPNFVEDIVLDPITSTTVGIMLVEFRPPLLIPPNGYMVMRAASNFAPNSRFVWLSATSAAVGSNDTNKLWVNGGPVTGAGNFLGAGNGVLSFELVGDKPIVAPAGACCNENGDCADNVLPWVCEGTGRNFKGAGILCASCNSSDITAGQNCRKCVGGGPAGLCTSDAFCSPGTCEPNNATCTGANFCSNDPNTPCPNGNIDCTFPATCVGPSCAALASCAEGACCNPATGACTDEPSDAACSGDWQGYGTTCDPNCCPVPDLVGLHCMGGPNNLDPCPNEAFCRKCVAGPFNGNTCSVHTDCARCVGGDTPGAVCTDNDDCSGNPDGVCTGHCLGNCVTRGTGANNCADAYVHPITVPAQGADPVTITITGDNSNASSTVEDPDSCWGIATTAGDEPGWHEAFSIDDCAWVRIDFCCSDPVHEPAYSFISADCDCINTIDDSPNPYHFGERAFFRGSPYCDEDNLWVSYGPLQAGTYYYSILSTLAGSHGPYQLHITVEACPDSACCLENGTCVNALNQTECNAAGGFALQEPQLGTPVPICAATAPGASGNPCNSGSCCTAPGECRDDRLGVPMTAAICASAEFQGDFQGGVRCGGGTCNGGSNPDDSCRDPENYPDDCNGGSCEGDAQDFAQPNPCPICEHLASDEKCHHGGGRYVWLSDLSSTVNPTRQCDDILVTSTATLSQVCVLGHYITSSGPRIDDCEDTIGPQGGPVEDHFTVRLYAPDPDRYFPGAILGQWETTHDPVPRCCSHTVPLWGNAKFYDFQLQLTPTAANPLVQLQAGQIYFLEVTNNTTNGMPECDFWMSDSALGQGNSYAFLDGCGTTYTEDSVKLFTENTEAMSDPTWCINVPFEPPPSPVRACCTGDPLVQGGCFDSTIRDCAEVSGNWQFDTLSCLTPGFSCAGTIEPNDVCANAPFVTEGSYGFNMFGTVRDGTPTESCGTCTIGPPVNCADSSTDIGGDIWYKYRPTGSAQAYIGTCDCERGGDEVVAVYHNPSSPTICPCPTDPPSEMVLLKCHDGAFIPNHIDPGGCSFFGDAGEVVLNVTQGNCYTIRVATFGTAFPVRNNLRISLSPAICGNGIREDGPSVPPVAGGGEQCDGTDDDLCPGQCGYTCLCPPPVCGKQCIGGPKNGQPCTTLADCPAPATACTGVLSSALGEDCDGAPGGSTAICGASTCRGPLDTAGDGPCTCVQLCGNNHREEDELCDGNDDEQCGGADCAPDCTCEHLCGNNLAEVGEQCDGASPALNHPCPGRCEGDCTCPPAFCGNNAVEKVTNLEECDGTATEAQGSECPPDECRPPNDPAGECTCSCKLANPPPGVLVWNSDPLTPERTTRSLRFRVQAAATATGSTGQDAIKVTPVSLQRPDPLNLPQNPPPNFSTFDTAVNGVCSGGTHPGHRCDTTPNCPGGTCGSLAGCTAAGETNGCARWVGKPATFLESQDNPGIGNYRAARLQCTPFYFDWVSETATKPIAVVGAEIAPSSEYSVQSYGASCKGEEADCENVSAPVTMRTRRSGDVEAPFNPPATSGQPNAVDVTQLVNKFKNATGALVKSIAQLQPNLPEQNADISALDIVAVVDGVKQFAYAFSGPCTCPSAVTCSVTPCATPGVCVSTYGAGALCVKTCNGGANSGDPCINNTHCPGGACSNGFCRDRCGRCN